MVIYHELPDRFIRAMEMLAEAMRQLSADYRRDVQRKANEEKL